MQYHHSIVVRRLRRTTVHKAASLLLTVIALADFAPLAFGQDAQGDDRVVSLVTDEQTLNEVIDVWNRAVRLQKAGKHDQVLNLLNENLRTAFIKAGNLQVQNEILDSDLFRELTRNDRILIYREGDQMLAKVYDERKGTFPGPGGRPTAGRIPLGMLQWNRDTGWLINLSGVDNLSFGRGCPVEGIRMDVTPKQNALNSWKDLELTVQLTNTSEVQTIPVQASPTFHLEWDLEIVAGGSPKKPEAEAFRSWHDKVDDLSSMPLPHLIEWSPKDHRVVELKPGESHSDTISLASLCGGRDEIPEGPEGKFSLYLVYDPNLEWNPYEAALPTWRHRIASKDFTITVGGEAQPQRK